MLLRARVVRRCGLTATLLQPRPAPVRGMRRGALCHRTRSLATVHGDDATTAVHFEKLLASDPSWSSTAQRRHGDGGNGTTDDTARADTDLPPFSGAKLAPHVAVAAMKETGLSVKQLRDVWELADKDKDGTLTYEEYCDAMKWVEQVQSGVRLPPAVEEDPSQSQLP